MKLTIVLTVYNKELYLRRAIDSLLNQRSVADGDYEILAVNDGSEDGSAAILEEYTHHNANFRVLTQQNQGLSMARNNGIDVANGEYIWFVDADDTIAPNAVELICGAMVNRPDVIPIYGKVYDKADKVIKCLNTVPSTVRDGKDMLLSGKWDVCGVFNIFRKSFLDNNNLRFYPHIFHEDTEFTPRMLYVAESVCVVPEFLYVVYKTPDSITQIPNPKRAFDYLFIAESNNKIIDDNNERGTSLGRVLCKRVSGTLSSGLNVMVKNNKKEWHKFNDALYNKRFLFKSMRQSGLWRYRLLADAFIIFPRKYVQIYKLFRSI